MRNKPRILLIKADIQVFWYYFCNHFTNILCSILWTLIHFISPFLSWAQKIKKPFFPRVHGNQLICEKHIRVRKLNSQQDDFLYAYVCVLKYGLIPFTYYLNINSRVLSESVDQSFIGTLMRKKWIFDAIAYLITLTFKNETQSWKPTLIFNEDIWRIIYVGKLGQKDIWILNLYLTRWIKQLPLTSICMQNMSLTKEKSSWSRYILLNGQTLSIYKNFRDKKLATQGTMQLREW